MQTQTRARNGGTNQQVLGEDGMGGEGDLETRVVGQEMQVLAEDVATFVASKIDQEQV